VAGFLMWGVLFDERTGLSFTTAAGPAIAVIFTAYEYKRPFYFKSFTTTFMMAIILPSSDSALLSFVMIC
jgi:hypothetical protein